MPDYPPLSTQVIGKAESALGALLAPVLAETGLTFLQWLVLVMAAANGADDTADRAHLVAAIAGARKIDPAEVEEAVDTLEAAAALQAGTGQIRLTDSGRAAHRRVQTRLEEITARLFDFPPEDLAAAGRILGIITERANAALTAS
jgi:DNA-binding MarR family transcriptional regulator